MSVLEDLMSLSKDHTVMSVYIYAAVNLTCRYLGLR